MNDEQQTPQDPENLFGDPVLWSPEIDPKTGEIKEGEIEGIYSGFSPFMFKENETTYCLVIDRGNGELYAVPDWFKIRLYTALNESRFVMGKTKVRLVFKGKQDIGSGQTMADFDFYADGVKIGKPLLSLSALKALHAAESVKEIKQ